MKGGSGGAERSMGGPVGGALVSGLKRMDSGSAFRAAPAVASLEMGFGKVMRANLGLIDVGGNFKKTMDLKNSVPLQPGMFNLAGEIKFNNPVRGEAPKPVKTAVPKVFHEAFNDQPNYVLDPDKNLVEIKPKLAKVATEPKIIKEAAYWFTDVKPKVVKPAEVIMSAIKPSVAPVVMPAVVPGVVFPAASEPVTKTEQILGIQVAPQIVAENRLVSPRVATQPQTQPQAQEQATIFVQPNSKEIVQLQDKENLNRGKMGLVEDRPKVETRQAELNEATELAAQEAEDLGLEIIEGWRILKKLAPQHLANRSETLNEEDPRNIVLDGSRESAKADIQPLKFDSVTEASVLL